MDRTEIIRRRIADLRSDKYAYLAEYLVEGNDLYVDTDTFVAEEWGDLLNFLENRVMLEGLKYDVAKEQEYMDFGKIYTGESLREYIDNICASFTTTPFVRPFRSLRSASGTRGKKDYSAVR